MNIFVTGGTGFIGSSLTKRLVELGHDVTVLTRNKVIVQDSPKGLNFVLGDPTRQGPWQEQVRDHEIFINLAGASIYRRWTKKNKVLIRSSRIETTKNLVTAMKRCRGKETLLLSTSAVGYYGFHGDEELDESDIHGGDFLAHLSKDWEAEALKAEQYGVKVLLCRLGIVLGAAGGTLGEMVPMFKYYLGSVLGSGEQWFSWIHQKDLENAIIFLLDRKDMSGPVNCVAPNPVRNREFTKALGDVLAKPSVLPSIPGFVIKLIKGEFGTVLLQGQRVVPNKLSHAGFEFQYPHINHALMDLLG